MTGVSDAAIGLQTAAGNDGSLTVPHCVVMGADVSVHVLAAEADSADSAADSTNAQIVTRDTDVMQYDSLNGDSRFFNCLFLFMDSANQRRLAHDAISARGARTSCVPY